MEKLKCMRAMNLVDGEEPQLALLIPAAKSEDNYRETASLLRQ